MKEPTPLELASRLGLRVEGLRAHGSFAGRPVELRVHAHNTSLSVKVTAPITPALDLGLDIGHRLLAPAAPMRTLGDPEIDAEFFVHADEIARVRRLFGEELRAHVVATNRASLEMRIKDDACVLGAREPLHTLDVGWTERALVASTKGAALVEAARAHVPAAHRLADAADELERYARSNGARFSPTPVWVVADTDAQRLEVVSRRTASGAHQLAAHVSFATPLGYGLELRRQSLADEVRSFFGADAIDLGHPMFQRQFVVQVSPLYRGRVGLLLAPEARTALLDLDAGGGPVAADDRGVRVDPLHDSVRPETLPALLDRLVDLGAQLVRAAHGASKGPYR